MTTRWRITIYGKVQGVYYRKSTQSQAVKLGLSGWVKNLPDGSVQAEIQGSEEVLEVMKKWCKQGPPMCSVTSIEKLEVPSISDEMDFEIHY